MISIEILEPTTYHRSTFANIEGKVYLDVDEQFSMRLTKVLEQMTDRNKIGQSAALPNSIPKTRKNELILQEYTPLIISRSTPSIKIKAQKDGDNLELDRLRVLENDDQQDDPRIEIELYGGGWIDDLEACSISELELGTFEYTQANVLAAWADTTALAVPAPANYGFFYTPGDLTRKDLRMKFNFWKLLKESFCSIGWNVKSPFYEGPIGSRLYLYLSPENWHDYTGKNSDWTVITDRPAPVTYTGVTEFIEFNEVQDINNQYSVAGIGPRFVYLAPDEQRVRLRITLDLLVTIPGQIVPPTFTIRVVKLRGFPVMGFTQERIVLFEQSFEGNIFQDIQVQVQIDFEDQDMVRTMDFILIETECLFGASQYPYTIESGTVTYNPNFRRYVEDNIIPLAELLNPEISCLDLLDAAVHLISGLIDTNPVSKTVTIYGPYNNQINGISHEGYFQRTQAPADLSGQVVPDSKKERYTESKKDRYILLRFADPDDAYISENSSTEHPFSRLVDLGSGNNRTTELDNPLIEPTLEIYTETSAIGGSTGLYLPAHWDNVDGELSSKIGVRIGYHHGLIQQQDQTVGDPLDFSFEGSTRTTLGYITQMPSVNIDGAGPFFTATFDQSAEDFYIFYQKYLLEFLSDIDIEFLVLLSFQQFIEFNFRKTTAVFYQEAYMLMQATAIKDFDVDRKISTPVMFKLITC